MTYLEDAMTKALDEMAARIAASKIVFTPMGDLERELNNFSYAPFTEYGYPPEHVNCKASSENFIDSTAIVIDPDVLALPAPGQKVVEDDL